MAGNEAAPLREGRALVERLRGLGAAPAPPTILEEVMDRVGLGDAFATFDTPLGRAFIGYAGSRIRLVDVGGTPPAFAAAYRARFGKEPRRVARLPDELSRALQDWAIGCVPPKLRFDLEGLGEFEQAVLRKTLEIPRGEVRPYAWVAREIGHPGATRAVGSALHRNPIPLLIPCHRVVRSDGSLGYYGLGDDAKRAVLAAEGLDVAGLEQLARSGVRYYGSDTTHIYCYPTCRHARRVMPAHRMHFRSEVEAQRAGYRPCKVCRPLDQRPFTCNCFVRYSR
jgi:O-6-methylguanine DNA methyltransferase